MAVRIGGDKYVAMLLLITRKDKQGRPLYTRIVRDNEEVSLVGGEEFLVVYADEAAVKPGSSWILIRVGSRWMAGTLALASPAQTIQTKPVSGRAS